MTLPRRLSLAIATMLVAASCSGSDADVAQIAVTSTAPTTQVISEPSGGVLYLQLAVSARIEEGGEGEGALILTLEGARRHTQWVTDDASGVTGTGQLVDEWTSLGLDQPTPQAAIVPADADEEAVLLTLGEPTWNEETRLLSFEAAAVTDPDPRLTGMVPSSSEDPVGTLDIVTVFIHHPTTPETPPSPTTTGPTTTTTTTTPDTTTTVSTTSTTPPIAPATSSTTLAVPVTAPPLTPQPTLPQPPTLPPTPTTATPPPTAPRPPDGEPQITTETVELRIESVGGRSTTFTLRNIGSGVGSWSATVPSSTGLSIAPSSGLLFPDRSTVVRVTYDGSGPNNDFATNITLTTAAGRTSIRVKVFPPA